MLGRYVCGARSTMSRGAVHTALDALGAHYARYKPELGQQTQAVTCAIEQHTAGPHVALVLDDSDGTVLWTLWEDGSRPMDIVPLADCPADDVSGDMACRAYLLHPGGHTWELTDPEWELWQAIAPELERMYPVDGGGD